MNAKPQLTAATRTLQLHRYLCKAAFHSLRLIFAYVGGPRASTIRMQERGQRCCVCKAFLGGPAWANEGPRACEKCQPTTVRVYMSFFVRGGSWTCGFLEQDLKTSIGRIRTFGSADKLRKLIARTPTKLMREGQQALEYALEVGRGGVWLILEPEQYVRLCKQGPLA